jgi:P27 family predicted phage terminase small subunit
MMKGGRKPVLRAIEGGLSKVPAPPAGLTAQGRQEWKRAAKDLIDRKVLAKSDLPALEAYATAFGMLQKIQPIASKADPIMISKAGGVKTHPAHTALQKYLALVLRFQGELGLTPASRNRRASQAPTAGDEWSEFDL